MKELDYEKDLSIDESLLDYECLEQPNLMMRYSRNLAETQKVLDKIKEEMELVKAQLDREIREHPEDYKIEKITDKAVEATIPLQREFVKVSEKLINAKYNVNIASGAVKSVEQRKDMLENLIKLHGQQYFAGPKVPHDLSEVRQQKNKKITSNMRSKIMERTK